MQIQDEEWYWNGEILRIDKEKKKVELPDSIERYEQFLWWDREGSIL